MWTIKMFGNKFIGDSAQIGSVISEALSRLYETSDNIRFVIEVKKENIDKGDAEKLMIEVIDELTRKLNEQETRNKDNLQR